MATSPTNDEQQGRQPSEAFPAIPKAILQRRTDTKTHRPFRPSPLSGKPTSPRKSTATDSDIGEEAKLSPKGKEEETDSGTESGNVEIDEDEDTSAKQAKSLEERKEEEEEPSDVQEASSIKPGEQPLIFKLTSESESESERNPLRSSAESEYPDDEISKLERAFSVKMDRLLALEKKFLDTERNATNLFAVIKKRYEEEVPISSSEINLLRRKLFTVLAEMDLLLERTVKLRDIAIEKKTTELVDRHVSEAELLLEKLEGVARELEIKRATSTVWFVKSILIWVFSAIAAIIALVVLLVFISEEEDVEWIVS